ncbi:MAG: cell division protein FtsW [Candidatus Magasanikbacteria bacterium RIFOXYC2_FULL_42_28]|uniref:Probable peptidoglycan glycosyltransferase FtsW n=1 Tax=Candidatus Magasanikbacteria bacterium RIFOXYC2_FULL_42_28 TaxID=1798704 RepID=A0A1F6NXJ7_9BACT|nr:MAG: cell division protein FtsW [Candidatus Magasanikbacteria bacterium RIFOXYC2_FULL_42_28]
MIGVAVKRTDYTFALYIMGLTLFGLVILTSASGPAAYEKFNDTYFFVKRQIMFGLLPGLALFFLFSKWSYGRWQKFSWVIYGGSLILLAAVFVPGVGLVLNGSHSWITLGAYSFQPAEFAKLGLIIATAQILSSGQYDLNDWRHGLIPVLAILFPPFLLILLQPDVGTLSILVVILFCMLFVAKVPVKYLAVLGALGVLVFTSLVFAAPYRLQRLSIFLHPELDPQGIGYHINQAFLAIGSGGFWGLGLGQSRQKFQYLPEVSADSIYAVLSEELGFIFAAGLVIFIVAIGWRGLKIAKSARDNFGKLLAIGIISWLVWQSFLNIGAMVGVLPLTGVPLPFVSHGGSALLTALTAAGMIVNISKN